MSNKIVLYSNHVVKNTFDKMSVNQTLSRPCKLRKKFVLSVVVRHVERSRGCNSGYHMVIKIVSVM